MTKRTRKDADPAALLEQIIVDTEDEAEQLWALAKAVATGVKAPADAFVVGEPVQVTAIDCEGDPRVGLLATCRRGDETYVVGFADVVFSPGTDGARFSAAYRTWLGLAPHDAGRSNTSGPTRRHKAEIADIDLSRPLELIVLARKSTALRCRIPGTERELTLRTPVREEIPGEIITVVPAKQWTHAGHPYLSGKVSSSRLDVGALGLVPLGLRPEGDWDPAEEFADEEDEGWSEEDEDWSEEFEDWDGDDEPPRHPDWLAPIIARGRRPMFEMEQVIPGEDPDDPDTDPILEAADLSAAGARGEAEDLLMGLLARDLRCIDAHAHLGNLEFKRWPEQALRHYAMGVSIGDLSLGPDFDAVLAWGFVDNRPFLRCLNGMGLCLWRLGRFEEAAATFTRMLWLNPDDNQGARFNLAEVEARRAWEESGDR